MPTTADGLAAAIRKQRRKRQPDRRELARLLDLVGGALAARADSPWGLSGQLYAFRAVYTAGVAKHLIDLDERALGAARAELGTTTIKDTVNEALRRATLLRARQVAAALDVLADADLDDRSDAWR